MALRLSTKTPTHDPQATDDFFSSSLCEMGQSDEGQSDMRLTSRHARRLPQMMLQSAKELLARNLTKELHREIP
ncbi:Protein of unknown function, partial [Gryllus bimaculatus]